MDDIELICPPVSLSWCSQFLSWTTRSDYIRQIHSSCDDINSLVVSGILTRLSFNRALWTNLNIHAAILICRVKLDIFLKGITSSILTNDSSVSAIRSSQGTGFSSNSCFVNVCLCELQVFEPIRAILPCLIVLQFLRVKIPRSTISRIIRALEVVPMSGQYQVYDFWHPNSEEFLKSPGVTIHNQLSTTRLSIHA